MMIRMATGSAEGCQPKASVQRDDALRRRALAARLGLRFAEKAGADLFAQRRDADRRLVMVSLQLAATEAQYGVLKADNGREKCRRKQCLAALVREACTRTAYTHAQ